MPYRLFAALLALVACAPLAVADAEAGGWTFEFQPYIWALGNEVRIATDEYDRSDYTGYFDALFNQYRYGFLWTSAIRKGNWGFYMDGHFVRLKDEGRELGLPFTSDVRQMLFEGALLYRFGGPANYVELAAGARYFRMRSDVAVTLVGSFNDLFAWVEPVAGLRASHALDKKQRWRAEIAADYGGFELGSDRTWQASGMLHYQFTKRLSLSVGYRHMDIEFHDGPRRYESEMSGPLIGFGFKFGGAAKRPPERERD